MINEYLISLISSKEILYSVVITLISIGAVCYYLFNERSPSLFTRLFLSISLTLIIGLLILFLSFIPVFYISKDFNVQFLIISIMFFLFYFSKPSN